MLDDSGLGARKNCGSGLLGSLQPSKQDDVAALRRARHRQPFAVARPGVVADCLAVGEVRELAGGGRLVEPLLPQIVRWIEAIEVGEAAALRRPAGLPSDRAGPERAQRSDGLLIGAG